MPYKYCASQQETARVRVSMEVEGDVSGAGASVSTAFNNFLKSLPAPSLTRPRKIANLPNGIKAHPCFQGDAEGRCYRTSAGQYAFVPLGGDENTFDYGLSGMSELGQLQTWIGTMLADMEGILISLMVITTHQSQRVAEESYLTRVGTILSRMEY